MNTYDDAELQARLDEEVTLQRIRREAIAIVEAETGADVDYDALFIDRGGLDRLPAPDPLIHGVLPRHAYGVLRGRDQSFKSFVALDWALRLATGRMWDMTPVEQVPVLYVAGEGAWGLRARVEAWEERHQVAVEPNWFTVRGAALNMHRPGPAFAHLLDHVRDGEYGLVVVDTLRRVSGAADGNGSEMGAVVDHLDQVKQATADGSLLVVAHTDKGDNDSRGYSGIEDDADFVWHARREGNRLELELTKMKDGPDGITVHLQAWPVRESLVLSHAVKPAASDSAPASEATLLATLRDTFPDGAYSGQLKEAAGLPNTTFHRALAALKARGDVVNNGSHQRPFYEASGLAGPTDSQASDSPSDLHGSHSLPVRSHQVPLLPRPLGSGSDGSRTGSEGLSGEQRAIIEGLSDREGEQ